MTRESPPDETIDRLYQLPLEEFVAARNQAARGLRGEEARAVSSLAKPSLVAWGLNQLYWSSRPVFDRLIEASARLKEAQAGGLLGKPTNLRGASADHRQAIAAAVNDAASILARAGHDAGPEALRSLTAALEALPWDERPGRLVRPPSPRGFGALGDIAALLQGGAVDRKPSPPKRETKRIAERQAGNVRQLPKGASFEARRRQREQERLARDQETRKEKEREAELRRKREQEAMEAARREAEAAAERVRAASAAVEEARAAERFLHEQLADARRRLKDAEVALQRAERDAGAAGAAANKARARKM